MSYTVKFCSCKPWFKSVKYYWIIRDHTGDLAAVSAKDYSNKRDCEESYMRLKAALRDEDIKILDK